MEDIAAMVVFTTLIICVTITSIVKSHHRSRVAQWGKDGNQQVPPMFEKMFEKAVADRDEKIGKMEARLRVLEQIVTDTHGSSKLAAEIDKLRDERV